MKIQHVSLKLKNAIEIFKYYLVSSGINVTSILSKDF